MSHSEGEKFAGSNNSDYFICRHCNRCFQADFRERHKRLNNLEDKGIFENEDKEKSTFYALQEGEVTFYINKYKEIIETSNKLRILMH